MNAVNLIPHESRTRRAAVSTSPQTIALLAGLALALAAVVLYVSAANAVTAKQDELSRLTARTAQTQALSTTFTGSVTAAQQLSSEVATIRRLAGTRFPWPRLLDQIGRLMPAGTALSSLQSGGTPGAATGSPASGAAGSPSAPTSLQLAGCATSHSTVAQTMERLSNVAGVGDVQLASSTENSANGSSSPGGAASAGGTTCPYPVQFQMSLIFGGPSGTAGAGTSTSGVTP